MKPLFSNHDDGDFTALKEAEVYFHDSFGNSTRIDYGTGHEMAFVMFLACLFSCQVLNINQDVAATGLLVFSKYMDLVRKLQLTYRMEPAGSQGVSWQENHCQIILHYNCLTFTGVVFGRLPICQLHLGCRTVHEWT